MAKRATRKKPTAKTGGRTASRPKAPKKKRAAPKPKSAGVRKPAKKSSTAKRPRSAPPRSKRAGKVQSPAQQQTPTPRAGERTMTGGPVVIRGRGGEIQRPVGIEISQGAEVVIGNSGNSDVSVLGFRRPEQPLITAKRRRILRGASDTFPMTFIELGIFGENADADWQVALSWRMPS